VRMKELFQIADIAISSITQVFPTAEAIAQRSRGFSRRHEEEEKSTRQIETEASRKTVETGGT